MVFFARNPVYRAPALSRQGLRRVLLVFNCQVLAMTRKQSLFSLGLVVSLAVVAGCKKEEPTPEVTAQSIPEQLQAAPPDVPGDPAGPSGDAFCDEYMNLSEKCVAEKVPESDRAGLNGLIKTMRMNYKRMSVTPDQKNQLTAACKRDLEHSKTAMGKYKCNWDSPVFNGGGAAAPADSAAAAGDAGAPAAGDAGAPAAGDAGSAPKKASKSKAPASK